METPFNSEIVVADALIRELPDRLLRELSHLTGDAKTAAAVDMYRTRVQSLSETGKCNIVICCRPDELEDGYEPPSEDLAEAISDHEADEAQDSTDLLDFHDTLKALTINLDVPLQVIRRETWSGKPPKRKQTTGLQELSKPRGLQDEATRAWNLHVALYYKAGGTPWRLPRRSSDMQTCFIGISFYRTLDKKRLHTAVAQVFNERGDGVVVRGGLASLSKDDRQAHLDEVGSEALLGDALAAYKSVHGNLPARIVIHKTSQFAPAERSGFHKAADDREIDHVDLIWIQTRAVPRLFRRGDLPPLRGTTVSLEAGTNLLYTRGSIEFFRTYPGLYAPRPILLHADGAGTNMTDIATEILGLSKMNWNNAQMDEREPLTLRTARQVGDILKHVPTTEAISNRYAKYM